MTHFIDKQSAKEFMLETLSRITLEELEQIQADLKTKVERMQQMVAGTLQGSFSEADYKSLLRCIFATRRRVEKIVQQYSSDYFAEQVRALLKDDQPVGWRFQAFFNAFPQLPETIRYDLTSEILFYSNPEQYWLWTRWMWDPHTKTGSLPLVLMEKFTLEGDTPGEIYERVGEAIHHLREIGKSPEIPSFLQTVFGAYTYLACVYVIYTYTVLRMRMTQEFNKVMPKLPEFTRRLLGIYSLEEIKHAS